MYINFNTQKLYYLKPNNAGFWCHDFKENNEYQLMEALNGYIMALSPDESLIAVGQRFETKQIVIYDTNKKQIIKTIPHEHYKYVCFSQDNSKLFVLSEHGNHIEKEKSAPLWIDLTNDTVHELSDVMEVWGGLTYDEKQNCIYCYGFCVSKLYKFSFDDLTITQIITDKKVKIRDCKISHDGRGYYYLGSNHLVFMDNDDNQVFKIDLRTKENLKNKTSLSFDICGNPDFIFIYLLDDRILICDLAKDEYKLHKIGYANAYPYFDSSICLINSNHHEILDLVSLESKPFLLMDENNLSNNISNNKIVLSKEELKIVDDFLEKIHGNDGLSIRTVISQMKRLTSAEQIHVLFSRINWDSRATMKVMNEIAKSPLTDKGTMLAMYYLISPDYVYLNYDESHESYQLLKIIENNLQNNYYPSGLIKFNVDDFIKDMPTLNKDHNDFNQVVYDKIPMVCKQSIDGKFNQY